MNSKEHVKYLQNWIKSKVEEAGANGVVLGISGGIDSAVLAHLLYEIYPKDTIGVWMSIDSSRDARRNALRVFEDSKIGRKELDLTEEYNMLKDKITSAPLYKDLEDYNENLMNEYEYKTTPTSEMSYANMKPRLRMLTLYQIAQENNYLVIGTSNLVELYLGYFTKFGDGAADIYPLANLTKTQVYELAKELGVNERIINTPPSADLWEGQTDEDHIGVTYKEIEEYLEGKEIDSSKKEIIERMHKASQHKIIENLNAPKEVK